MSLAHLKQALAKHFDGVSNLTKEEKGNLLARYERNCGRGADPQDTFASFVRRFGNGASPERVLQQATASLLNDEGKPKSHYETRVEFLKKRFKVDSLSFVGMEEPKPADAEKKEAPKVSLGDASYKGRSIPMSLQITI